MTSILTFGEMLSVFQKLEATVRNIVERRDIIASNKDMLQKLKRQYGRAYAMIQKLEPYSATDFILEEMIHEHTCALELNFEALISLQTDVEKAKVVHRVKRMKQTLQQCETDVEKCFHFLITHVSPTVRGTIPEQHHDIYMRDNNVPGNPPRLTLDYSTTSTCEGQLKAAVLEEDESSRRVLGVVASGQGGVGKTCSLRGLATDPDIKNRFGDGTLYIQLGKDARVSDIIHGIAVLARRTGGVSAAHRIRAVKTLQEACNEGSLWFRSHTCLFLIDDIWWAHGIDASVFRVLGTMVSSLSRLVFTTRDRRFLGRGDRVIEFSEKETQSELARRMLMTHAGFEWMKTLNETNERAIRGVLEICRGLPLAFGVAGALVRKYSRGRVDDVENAWSHVYDRICLRRESIVEDKEDEYGSVQLIVDSSIDVLDSEHVDGRFGRMFRALCVLEKQQIVPAEMLRTLWGFESVERTEEVIDKLDEVCVVRKLYDGAGIFIQLHDLILDIAFHKAIKRQEVTSFFKMMIRNYKAQERKRNKGKVVTDVKLLLYAYPK